MDDVLRDPVKDSTNPFAICLANSFAGLFTDLSEPLRAGETAGSGDADAGDVLLEAVEEAGRLAALAGGAGAASGKACKVLDDALDAAKKEKKTPELGGEDDHPPGWNDGWEWMPSPRARQGQDGWRWHGESRGKWRRHSPDRHHGQHWDYNANNSWSGEWKNVDDSGNIIPKAKPKKK